MKQFQLSRQPRGETITRFHVIAADGSIVGIINVPNEETDDLERHWVGAAPQKAVAAVQPVSKQHPNPVVAAMLAAAPRNRLSKQAVLRGCP
jgi:hypothetical protein